MYTIQQIESMDLSQLSRKEFRQIRDWLNADYHYATTKDLLSDGRSRKNVIGEQHSRFVMFGMTNNDNKNWK